MNRRNFFKLSAGAAALAALNGFDAAASNANELMRIASGIVMPKLAFGAPTLIKDGLDAAGTVGIYVDTSKINVDNCSYSLPSEWVTRRYINKMAFFVKWSNFKNGSKKTFDSLTLRFPDAAIDRNNNRIDLLMTFTPTMHCGFLNTYGSNPNAAWPGTAYCSVLFLFDSGAIEVNSYVHNTSFGGYGELHEYPNRLLPANETKVDVKFVKRGTNEQVNDTYLVDIRDIDQPCNLSKENVGFAGPFAESIEPVSGFIGGYHTQPNTFLVVDGNRIRGTERTTGNEDRSGFASVVNSAYSLIWRASYAGTLIFTKSPDNRGTVKVTKRVTGEQADKNKRFHFNVAFSGSAAPDPVSFDLADGESYLIRNINAGVTAQVTETADRDYKTTWNPQTQSVTVVADQETEIVATNERRFMILRGKKQSDWPDLLDHSLYSLAGARFECYYNGELVGTMTSDASGNVSDLRVYKEGTYTIKEVQPPLGHLIQNPDTITVQANYDTNNGIINWTMTDPTGWFAPDSMGYKLDSDSGAALPQGDSADWSGMIVEMRYWQNHDCSGNDYITTRWRSDRDGKIPFADAAPVQGTWPWRKNGRNTIPVGSYEVREVQAPVGYRLSSAVIRKNVTEDSVNDL